MELDDERPKWGGQKGDGGRWPAMAGKGSDWAGAGAGAIHTGWLIAR